MNCPHCNTHIDEHEASLCLNAWVGEVVMKLDRVRIDEEDGEAIFKRNPSATSWGFVPQYSVSIAAAWQVLEKLSADGYSYQVLEHSDPKRGDCLCELWKDFYRWNVNHQDTVPLAICRAAIKAISG